MRLGLLVFCVTRITVGTVSTADAVAVVLFIATGISVAHMDTCNFEIPKELISQTFFLWLPEKAAKVLVEIWKEICH